MPSNTRLPREEVFWKVYHELHATVEAESLPKKNVLHLVKEHLALEYGIRREDITRESEGALNTVASKITRLLVPVSKEAHVNLEREMANTISFNNALLIARGRYTSHAEIAAAEAVKKATRPASPSDTQDSVEGELRALLAIGENAKVEFKSSARWDLRENKKSVLMELIILKTAAAFLNSDGGTLLLGVSDDGTAVGLEHDYQTLQKKNADGYELFLSDLLFGHFGKNISPFISMSFHQLDGREVGLITVQPAPSPIWVKEGVDEHLYIRAGNSTRRLSTREALAYFTSRFSE